MVLWAGLSLPIGYNLAAGGAWLRLTVATATMALAVLLSRGRPLWSVIVVVLATLMDGNFLFAIPVLSYLLGLRHDRVGPVAGAFTAIAVGGSVVNLAVLGTTVWNWFLLVGTLLFAGVFPWLVGRYRAQQQRLVVAGWQRAEHLERERRHVAEQARLRERNRIATEMHDSLGHDLSLIALRAAALEVAADLSAERRAAAGQIRADAAAATDRLRDTIGLLRDPGQPATLEPVDERVDDLVARARGSGMAVTLRCTGDPAAVPGQVARTVHRVVQESLTNAVRHAPGAAVEVTVTHLPDDTTVTVVNTNPVGTPHGAGGGTGLAGIAERVRLTGGTCTAAPAGGGFRVAARLPHAAAPAPVPGLQGDAPPPALPHGVPAPVTGSPVGAHAVDLRAARRRVRRSLAAAVLVPAALAAVTAAGYYPIASFDAVLNSADFDRVDLGASRVDVAGLLPRRQVQPPSDPGPPPVPAGAACEYYTDGNFPFAQASYRLCFARGILVARDDLRTKDR